MAELLKMRMDYDLFNTPLPNVFIDEYMLAANPSYSMVYILAFRYCFHNDSSLSISDIAEKLHMLESDVINAWRFWEKQGLINILNNDSADFSIEFITIGAKQKAPKIRKNIVNFDDLADKRDSENEIFDKKIPDKKIPDKTNFKISNNLNANFNEKNIYTGGNSGHTDKNIKLIPENSYKLAIAAQPSYSPKEINIYMERSDEIRSLFKFAERLFAKPLAHTELNMLLSFLEWYALPLDVIKVMLQYCVSINKKSRRYMETVARDWSENEITTVEEANDYIGRFDVYATILRAYGITGKVANKKQISYMKQWLYEYKLSLDVILEACQDTFASTGSASFKYTHEILTDWFKNNVQTLSDVEQHREAYQKSKKARAGRPSKNSFINYEQREWDYDKIEKLALLETGN